MPKFVSNNSQKNSQKEPKNFGYGGSLSFAGCNALRTTMAGQYHSIASHSERWKLFCEWAKTQNVREARQINTRTLNLYGDYLRARLEGQGKPLAVSTAQNRLSTCNTVLRALRSNRDISIKPAEVLQAKRQHSRTHPPELSREKLAEVQQVLCHQGHGRIAAVLGLCRELGLRSREAVLLDCNHALNQARALGKVDIERGTKGGRGKSTITSPSRVERWVPASESAINALTTAAALQKQNDNLIPENKRLPDFLCLVRHYSGVVLKQQGLTNRHDLRAAYACERYQQLTGYLAPVFVKKISCSKENDQCARSVVAQELGHNRVDVIASYVGSYRAKA